MNAPRTSERPSPLAIRTGSQVREPHGIALVASLEARLAGLCDADPVPSGPPAADLAQG